MALGAVDTYAVVTLLPQMMASLELPIDHIEQATPIVSGFLAGYVVALPLLGTFSDARGRLPAYAAGLLLFALGSLLTATAGSSAVLISGRTLQGLGGGALVPLSLALAADLFSGARLAPAVGGVSAVQEAGSVLGPVWGAALAGWLGNWRGVFWLNLPLAAFLLGGLLLTASRDGARAAQPRLSGVDWVGAVLFGLALGLVVLALYPDEPSRHALNSMVAPLGVAAAAAVASFVWWQRRRVEPLVGGVLVRSPALWASLVANVLGGAALVVALVEVPLLGRGVYGLSTTNAGLLLTRFLLGLPLGALAGGLLAGRLGRRITAIAGFCLAAASYVLMSTWGGQELTASPLRAELELALAGAGFGLVIAPLTAVVIEVAGPRQRGLGGSLVVLARTLGMVLGLAALTAYGLARFQRIFDARSCGTPSGANLGEQVSALETCTKGALLQEYRELFLIAAAACVLAALLVAVWLRTPTIPPNALPAKPARSVSAAP
ncbi:MAG: MFS transporter [Candidatus Dormibacteraeota bacterium]|nr:MFS transporter [Candidatus Dormibacteraeota bacterium]